MAQTKIDFIKEAPRLLGSGGEIVVPDGFLVKDKFKYYLITKKDSRGSLF